MGYQSTLDLKDKEKIDTIVKLLESARSQIMTWHNQAYIAATASLGLLLGITKLWLDTEHKTGPSLMVFEVGIVAVTVLAYLYLDAALHNYNGNEEIRVKCEYALRLKDQGTYFEGARFVWAPEGEDKGMPSHDIRLLQYSDVIAGFVLAVACFLSYWDPALSAVTGK